MKLVIVDDEPLARERLRRMIDEFPGWQVVGEASNGRQAVACIKDLEPDVVLMDIHMPDVDGLQAARKLAEMAVPPAVIFVTAHSEHALSAHEAAAAGYLLKPIRREQLAQALQRARRPSRAQLQAIQSGNEGEHETRQFIHANTREGLVRVPVNDVVYFLAEQKYVTVHHLHGQMLIEDSLRTLEDDLDDRFLRVHRKALVATRFMQALERGEEGLALRLRNADKLVPVSRRCVADVRKILNTDN